MQAPQCAASFVVLTSQPLPALPSQSALPGLQLETVHCPPLQSAPPFATEQTLPQVPQFCALLLVVVSQPLPALLSQFPKPGLHATILQTLPWHSAVPFVLLQTLPQPLQLFASVVLSVSQPLSTLPSQLAQPMAQPIWHCPALHDAVPLKELHTLPHCPQLPALVLMFVSQPFSGFPSQSPKPSAQVMPQMPLVQEPTPCALLHVFPQAPQFDVLLPVLS